MASHARRVSASEGPVGLRFGEFEYDPQRRELKKFGVRVRIQRQPMAILLTLLESPGSLVTRDELRARLWDSATFVAFEHGLNSAIKRLRDVLCDSVDHPRYIETVPGEGYRFIASVERLGPVLEPSVETIQPARAIPTTRSGELDHHPARRKIWMWVAGVAAAVIWAMIAVSFQNLARPHKPRSTSQAPDWVLITDFENRTGENDLDGTLEYALERELSSSQIVTVVPHERVVDVLRLMRKPIDTKIDAALGREICSRDGGIRLLLTGRVEKLGTTYALTAHLVDSASGVITATIAEESLTRSGLASPIRRLSQRLRETLSEEHQRLPKSDERLDRVTTRSLHALQLYTHADNMMRHAGSQVACGELLEQAVAEDPEFASAHLLLAWTYENRGLEAKARSEFQHARDLADFTAEDERLFILGSYYEAVEHDPHKAMEAYESLLELYPNHFWAANNLPLMYALIGRWDDSSQFSVVLADRHPDVDLFENLGAACIKCLQQDMRAAQPYITRVAAIEQSERPTWVEPLLIFQSWSAGDLGKAHEQLQEYASRMNDSDPTGLPFLYLAFGEFGKAERAMHEQFDMEMRNAGLGVIKFLEGDLEAAREDLAAVKGHLYDIDGLNLLVMGRCGLWNNVDTFIRENPKDSPSVKIIRGERALARGQVQEGITLLEEGRDAMKMFPTGTYFLGSESLAQAYQKRGELEAALRVLEEAHAAKKRAYSCVTGPMMLGAFWLRTELQLVNQYRKMHRVSDAEMLEDQLSKLLIYADPNHPIVRDLCGKRSARAALAANSLAKSSFE
jgi:DNA-binding winged helix-turn-helix (wHTH) protein/tetratricopeptide (TPR) repeat protein